MPDLVARFALAMRRDVRIVSGIRGMESQRPAWTFRADGLTSRAVALYIANSEVAAAGHVARGLLPQDRVVVVPNGIDADSFAARAHSSDRARLRREWGVADGTLLAAVVGHVSEAKGHGDIVAALARTEMVDRDIRFVFCGSDVSRGGISRIIRRTGLADRVLELGRRDDVAAILAASDLCVLASHHEGMPNAIMEAMAMELPVVATCVGGVPELVEEGTTGLLVPVAEPAALAAALAKIHDHGELAETLGKAGAKRIRESYGLDLMARRTAAAYLALGAGMTGRSVAALVSEASSDWAGWRTD